jgi:hypothetical protein
VRHTKALSQQGKPKSCFDCSVSPGSRVNKLSVEAGQKLNLGRNGKQIMCDHDNRHVLSIRKQTVYWSRDAASTLAVGSSKSKAGIVASAHTMSFFEISSRQLRDLPVCKLGFQLIQAAHTPTLYLREYLKKGDNPASYLSKQPHKDL